MLVELPELKTLPADELPVLAAEEFGGKRRAIVELPPVGFAWVAAADEQPIREWSGDPIASNLLLRNEHCEVRIHPETGGIQSIHDYKFALQPAVATACVSAAAGVRIGRFGGCR